MDVQTAKTLVNAVPDIRIGGETVEVEEIDTQEGIPFVYVTLEVKSFRWESVEEWRERVNSSADMVLERFDERTPKDYSMIWGVEDPNKDYII